MGALGYVMNVPEEEKYLNTKKELEAQIVMALGGRAAEEIVFDTVFVLLTVTAFAPLKFEFREY